MPRMKTSRDPSTMHGITVVYNGTRTGWNTAISWHRHKDKDGWFTGSQCIQETHINKSLFMFQNCTSPITMKIATYHRKLLAIC